MDLQRGHLQAILDDTGWSPASREPSKMARDAALGEYRHDHRRHPPAAF